MTKLLIKCKRGFIFSSLCSLFVRWLVSFFLVKLFGCCLKEELLREPIPLESALILSMYLIGLIPFGLAKIFSSWLYAKKEHKKAS